MTSLASLSMDSLKCLAARAFILKARNRLIKNTYIRAIASCVCVISKHFAVLTD